MTSAKKGAASASDPAGGHSYVICGVELSGWEAIVVEGSTLLDDKAGAEGDSLSDICCVNVASIALASAVVERVNVRAGGDAVTRTKSVAVAERVATRVRVCDALNLYEALHSAETEGVLAVGGRLGLLITVADFLSTSNESLA